MEEVEYNVDVSEQIPDWGGGRNARILDTDAWECPACHGKLKWTVTESDGGHLHKLCCGLSGTRRDRSLPHSWSTAPQSVGRSFSL